MTVIEMIEVLKGHPPSALVYVWDGDNDRFTLVESVAKPSREAAEPSGLPTNSVVVWGS